MEPVADLCRAPPALQLLRDQVTQEGVGLQPARVDTGASGDRETLGPVGLVLEAVTLPGAAVVLQLTADRRRRAPQLSGDGQLRMAGQVEVGDEEAFLLRQVAAADLADGEAFEGLLEPDDFTVAIDLRSVHP